MTNTRAQKIEKEQLKECAFRKPINRSTEHELRERNRRLYLAMLMGNNFESKAKIIFNTLEGYKEVFTTVWATTEKFILLKGGTHIPIEAIAHVELENVTIAKHSPDFLAHY
ncbi:MAG: hypothetical protein NTY88_09160 [Bacteroidetes bacterium]|nr:hypothetical protein [Bacteroidota bacterium]